MLARGSSNGYNADYLVEVIIYGRILEDGWRKLELLERIVCVY
jgi:hypothetical protein